MAAAAAAAGSAVLSGIVPQEGGRVARVAVQHWQGRQIDGRITQMNKSVPLRSHGPRRAAISVIM